MNETRPARKNWCFCEYRMKESFASKSLQAALDNLLSVGKKGLFNLARRDKIRKTQYLLPPLPPAVRYVPGN